MIRLSATRRASDAAGTASVFFQFEGENKPVASPLNGAVKALEQAKSEGFRGRAGELATGRLANRAYMVIGLGDETSASLDSIRRGIAAAVRRAGQTGVQRLATRLPSLGSAELVARAAAEGAILGLYRFTAYQSRPEIQKNPTSLELVAKDADDQRHLSDGLRTGEILAAATNLVRDLVNTPPSDMDPDRLVQTARSIAKGPIRLRVFKKAQLKQMSFGGVLGVNRGSAKPPYFLHITYKPKGRAKRRIGICGKGITFDSGGLSLKTAAGMETMKTDMAGCATVLAVIEAARKLNLPVEIHGFTPITENMPGGDAVKPGDVLRAHNGKTIEVLNTDAEGRLILSDALAYASRQGLDEVLDIATLTGACMIALGPSIFGLMGTDANLKEKLTNAAFLSGEKLWELPLESDYKSMIRSHVADVKNIGEPGKAGTIIGGLFLQHFVDPNLPWAHLDIASTEWSSSGGPLNPPGATGVAVRTLLTYLMSYN